ncbi:hypothetical protein SAMN02745866_04318 [Alteromonadaceae bacterium Bs31]|nr:hypothetical protein SAMN02745866_04318 [Alteromonadaceae bacterium Bs31]
MKLFSMLVAFWIMAIASSVGAATVVQKNWELDQLKSLNVGIKVSVKVVDYLCDGQPEITINIPEIFNKREYKASGFTIYKDSNLFVSSNLVAGKVDERNREAFFCLGLELLPLTQVEIHYGVGEHITDTVILKNLGAYAGQPNS